jgi:prepilin-type N-terminal cleavage/methylation domain-containing protein
MRKYLLPPFKAQKRNEDGFSLVELLVAIGVFAIIAVVATSIILTLNSSTQRFGATSTTQNELAEGISTINTDISAASSFEMADNNDIKMLSYSNNVQYETTLFYYGPGTTVPSNVNVASLPTFQALMSQVQVVGSSAPPKVTVLVPGFDPTLQTEPLFSFFDSSNNSISTPISTSAGLTSISRVEFYVSAKLAGRTNPVELASSATPNSLSSSGVNAGGTPTTPNATFLQGSMTYAGVSTPLNATASLNWTIPAGATSYTLYRTLGTTTSVAAIIPDPATHTITDPGLVYGNTYTYYLVANGPQGTSPQSNSIHLTVVPPKVQIVNINTTKSLSATESSATESGTTNPLVGSSYTVARSLSNQITWAPSNGATGYKVFEDGSLLQTVAGSVNSYVDTTPNYGDTHVYTVMAYNVGENGSGGNGTLSDSVSLISPPVAPPISVTADSSSTGSTSDNIVRVTARPVHSTGFNVYDSTNTAGLADCTAVTSDTGLGGTGTSWTATTAWGSSTCYAVSGYNDAGEGPRSVTSIANQGPGPFAITTFSENSTAFSISQYYSSGYSNAGTTEGFSLGWSASSGNTNYTVSRSVNPLAGAAYESSDPPATTTAQGVSFSGQTPGAAYTFTVTATAPDGVSRNAVGTYYTSPDIPYSVSNYIQTRAGRTNYARRDAQTAAFPANGGFSGALSRAWYNDDAVPGYTEVAYGAGTYFDADSLPGEGGNTKGEDLSYWYAPSGTTLYSGDVGFSGWIGVGGCLNPACQAGFADAPESGYAAGHHSYYISN